MGNCFGAASGEKGLLDMGKKMNKALHHDKTEAEKRFDELAKAVEMGEKDDTFIHFRYTGLESVDDIVFEAQKVVNDIHKIRVTLKKSMEKLLNKTHIWDINGANSMHAILAMIYAIYAQSEREEAENLLIFHSKFPFIKKGKDSKGENVAKDIKILFDYIQAMESAAAKMPGLVKDSINLAKDALKITDTYQDDIKKADGAVGMKAMKSVPHNIKMLKRTKLMANATSRTISKLVKELTAASVVITKERNDLPDYGQTLADEGITEPLECYKKVGQPVEPVDPPTTKDDLLDFPYIEEEYEEKPEELDGEAAAAEEGKQVQVDEDNKQEAVKEDKKEDEKETEEHQKENQNNQDVVKEDEDKKKAEDEAEDKEEVDEDKKEGEGEEKVEGEGETEKEEKEEKEGEGETEKEEKEEKEETTEEPKETAKPKDTDDGEEKETS